MSNEAGLTRLKANIARIASGSALGQAVLFASTPLLTRLYAPEDFGTFAILGGLHAMFATLATLKLDAAIIVPASDDDARGLTVATMASTAVAATLLTVGLMIARMTLLDPPRLHTFALPLMALSAAAFTCAQQWAGRRQQYLDFARAQVIAPVVNSVIAVGFGALVGGATAGLLLGFIVGQTSAVAYMVYRAPPRVWHIDFSSFRDVVRRFIRFPFYVLPSTLLTTAAVSAQPFVLGHLFPISDVGQFAVANRVLLAPSALVGGAISEAFRSELNQRIHNKAPVTVFARHVVGRAAAIATVMITLIALVGPIAFRTIFGDDYDAAGTIILALIPGAVAHFVMTPFQHVFVAAMRLRLAFFLQIVVVCAPLTSLILAGTAGKAIKHALLVAGMSSLTMAAIVAVAAYRVLKQLDAEGPHA